MTGKTHQIIGIAAGIGSYLVLVPPHYTPATFAAVCVVSSLGALLPDIDSGSAKIWQELPLGGVASHITGPFLQHRNLTHSLLGVGIVAYLLYQFGLHIPGYWGLEVHRIQLAAIIAYGSHLLADAVTVEGIPLFFPNQHMFGIPPRPFQGLRMETGKWFENWIVFPAVNIGLVVLIAYYWSNIQKILFK
jgi:membrane-bound metal-dependent hydrolase YbcI (DUF457 family)